jgi:hypothetical protein
VPVTLADYSLVSLADFKGYLRTPTAAGTTDDQLTEILNGVSGYMERYTSRVFQPRTFTDQVQRYLSPTRVLLKYSPVIALTALTLAGTVQDTSAYLLDPDGGMVELQSGRAFPSGLAQIKATYQAGYNPLLGDDVAACLDLAYSVYQEWMNGAISLSSLSVGPMGINIRPGINPRVQKYLDTRREVRG